MSLSLFTRDQSNQPQGSRRRRAYADGELIMDGNASATDKSVPVGKTVWTRRCWDGCIRLAVDARGTGRTSFEDKVTSSASPVTRSILRPRRDRFENPVCLHITDARL